MHLTPGMIHDLKSVSDLSTRTGWEYAGKLDITRKKGKLVYRGITYATSKQRGGVQLELVLKMWDGPVPRPEGDYIWDEETTSWVVLDLNK